MTTAPVQPTDQAATRNLYALTLVVFLSASAFGSVAPMLPLFIQTLGVTVPNAPGTIDSDYRGEVKVALINLGRGEFVVTSGTRIAQLVIAPVAQAHVIEVDELSANRLL